MYGHEPQTLADYQANNVYFGWWKGTETKSEFSSAPSTLSRADYYQQEEHRSGWDNRTPTLTFQTFRPTSPEQNNSATSIFIAHQAGENIITNNNDFNTGNGTQPPANGATNRLTTENLVRINGTTKQIPAVNGSDPNHTVNYAKSALTDYTGNSDIRGPSQRKIFAEQMANGCDSQNGVLANGSCRQNGIAVKKRREIVIDLTLLVRLLVGETRVGFSMCGGRDESLPSMINNIMPGSPADRAGLSIGDEIIEVNGISVERATHAEIVQHIHKCIKSRTIQLRVRRKQEEENSEQNSSQSTSTSRVTDAYLISVNEQQKTDVADTIQLKYPGTKTYDMETVHARLEAGQDPLPVTSSHPLQYRNGDITRDNMLTVQGRDATRTPSPQHTVAQMYYGYDNQPKISPRDHNQNSTTFRSEVNFEQKRDVYANSCELENFGHTRGESPPAKDTILPSLIENGMDSPDEKERLRLYEEELKRRKEREERMAKEQAFLRSSLRGSKKLQALEKTGSGSNMVSGVQNAAFDSGEEDRTDSPIQIGVRRKPVALQDVLLSVNQVTTALDNFAEHRKDSEFLRKLFSEQEVQNAIEVTAVVQKHWGHGRTKEPVTTEAFQDSDAVLKQLGDSISDPAAELQEILETPHLQAALYTHDRLAGRVCDSEYPSTSNGTIVGLKETSLGDADSAGNLRIIKLIKMDDHYLGATVRNDGERIVIGRIVKGGVAEKTRLLKENDELLEVNGVDLRGKSVNDVCDLLRNMTGELTFIVNPYFPDENQPDASSSHAGENGTPHSAPLVRHMRALFDYDPEDDFYVPCRELGLKFQKGDILHVLSMADEQWWQAFREGDDPNQQTLAGLIPSSSFQTQRELYRRELLGEGRRSKQHNTSTDSADNSLFCARRPKKHKNKQSGKVTHLGGSRNNNENAMTNNGTLQNGTLVTDSVLVENMEDEEILTYEEVALFLSRTGRKRPVVLVGPPKVGCLELRARLMETDKEKFAGVVPHTSRNRNQSKEVDGIHYCFVTKQKFLDDVENGSFVEWGEFQKNYYGTSFQAIQKVVDRGKTCVLALQAQSLKTLRNSDLMPFVVFISPPSLERLKMNRMKLQKTDNNYMKDEELRSIIYEGKRMEEDFGHLFDKVIVNIDLDRSFQELRNTIHRLETEPHWVPSYWLTYEQNSSKR